jgi:3-hydroxyacyl-CoA dehydrogenase/3a,7a,12a-trihydroxy-5b-cholest-24-enoyl-CoA hydratase
MVDSAWDIPKALKHSWPTYEVTKTEDDCILYALGIGFSKKAMDATHYRYTYENDENFAPFPTIPVVIGHGGDLGAGDMDIPGMPKFNPMSLLHGEESVTFIKPIEPNTKYNVTDRVSDIQDKVKGALLVVDGEIKNAETGELVCIV